MRRPSATALLLVLGAGCRTAALLQVAGDLDLAGRPSAYVVLLEVLVPLTLAGLDHRGRGGAGVLTWAGLQAGVVVRTGLALLQPGAPLPGTTALLVVSAALLAVLAGATRIGRWQDEGAPPRGGRPPSHRTLRAVVVTAGALVALALVRSDVAVLGTIAFDGLVLPGPVGLASTLDPLRLPLLVGALVPLAWAATRADPRHLTAAGAVLGARALVEVGADVPLLTLGLPTWPLVVVGVAGAALLVAPLATRQVSSSSA